MRWAVVAVMMLASAGSASAQCATRPADAELLLSRPVGGSIVGEFGETWSDALAKKVFNKGILLETQPAEPVYAAASGTVVQSGPVSATAVVLIDHGGEVQTLYSGLGSVSFRPGACVKAGEQIGTASTDTPFIHFELRKAGQPTDPTRLIQ